MSLGWPLFLLALLAAAGGGGYHAYCVYETRNMQHRFGQAYQDLHQTLLAAPDRVGAAEVEAAVRKFAREGPVRVLKLKVKVEPLTAANQELLSSTVQFGLNVTGKLRGHRKPRWIIGFKGLFEAKKGTATHRFTASRYTWFDGNYIDAGDDQE